MSILHIIFGTIGFYLLYLTFVMEESVEGRWVNRIEELWVQIDDRSKTVGETTKSLCRKLAKKISLLFDRILGTSIISVRVVGISGSLSFASMFSFFGLFLEVLVFVINKYGSLQTRLSDNGRAFFHADPLLITLGVIFFLVAGICLTLAVLPIFFRSRFWAWLSCTPTAFWLYGTLRLIRLHSTYEKQLGVAGALAVSIISDIVLLAIVRQSMNWILNRTTIVRIVAAIGAQAVAFCLILIIPTMTSLVWFSEIMKGTPGQSLFVLALFNIPTAVASFSFVISLIVVLLHRLSWPLLSQWTYVLTRSDVLEKRKTLRAVGGVLLLYGLNGLSGPLWRVAQAMLK